jgi:hypothetical protein
VIYLYYANPSHLSILGQGGAQEGRAKVGISSVYNKVSSNGTSIIINIVIS